jgi:cytochrome c oxidase subunit 2
MNELLRRLLALPDQASSVARDLDAFHYVVIGVTMVGAFGVALAAAWFSIRYRHPSTVPASFDRRTTRRVEYWMLGVILLLFLAFWVVGLRQYMHLRVPPPNTLDVYVVAKQWMWRFSHTEGPAELGTLTVPAGRPVRLIMTSRDVIHSLFVPAFRIKQDVLPGRYTTVWFEADKPGSYPLYCAEFCGVDHSIMHATVVVLPPESYGEWLSGQVREAGVVSMVERGAQVAAEKQCLSCHTVDGRRHVGPTWRGLYQSEVRLTSGETVRADEAYLTRSMMRPFDQVVEGYPALMPSFEGLLSPAEVGALVEYIRSLEPSPNPEIENAPPLWPEQKSPENQPRR